MKIPLCSRPALLGDADLCSVAATMLAPDDPKWQLDYVAIGYARHLNFCTCGKCNDGRGTLRLVNILADASPESALRNSIPERIAEGRIAGHALLKQFIFERLRESTVWESDQKRFGDVKKKIARYHSISDREMERVWARFKSVSHLWGAEIVQTALQERDKTGERTKVYRRRLYALACELQMFATTYVPPRQQAPLIPAEAIWQLPTATCLALSEDDFRASAHDLGRWIAESISSDRIAELHRRLAEQTTIAKLAGNRT